MTRSELLERLGITHPLILSPMAGGPGTPELAAAVSNAGGLGSLGLAYSSAEQSLELIARTRALTDKPFAVNLFAAGPPPESRRDPAPMLAILAEIHAALGLPAPTLPRTPADPFPAQLAAVLEARPAVFSFTFGIPDSAALRELRRHGIAILGTATTVEEGRLLAEAGVDGIVAQGAEAGAHRGTFAAPFEAAMVPVLELVRGLRAASSCPVVASGGLMDGRDIGRALRLGAAAAQLGTAFLASPESGAAPAYKDAILAARRDTTVITRAFSGRPARGLRNEFIARLAGREDVILSYPLQNALTRAMRGAAAQRGEGGFLSLWAGQGVARTRAMPAAALVRALLAEADATVA